MRLEGLTPGCVYDYTVTIDGVGGETYSNKFRTAPDKNTPIRFVSYADCETTDGHLKNHALNLARMQSRRLDLITAAGDLTARGGIQSHWDEFWRQNAGKKYADSDKKYTDILGAIPMLTAIGNHDLFDNADHTVSGGWFHDRQGEVATEKFLSYFEFNPNGVEYAFRDGTTIPETRDMSQLFHREDYGPVTLIFLDTNNGQDGDTDADHNKDANYDKPGDATNPLAYWQGSGNYGGTGSYGFLETDVTTNANARWTCTITPVQGSHRSRPAAPRASAPSSRRRARARRRFALKTKQCAMVTIRNDFAMYTVDVVVASFVKGKVNLAYGGEGAADEVTLHYWYDKNCDLHFAPRHRPGQGNDGGGCRRGRRRRRGNDRRP